MRKKNLNMSFLKHLSLSLGMGRTTASVCNIPTRNSSDTEGIARAPCTNAPIRDTCSK